MKKENNTPFGLIKIRHWLLVPSVIKLLKLDKLNKVYRETSEKSPVNFIDAALEELKITYEVSEADLKNIPSKKPFILVANHPYGGIDGMIMLSVLIKVRPDFKVMANYLLQHIPELHDHLIKTDPFNKPDKKALNISAVRKSMKLLKQGTPIGIFPAGEVSSLQLNTMKVTDKMWHPVVGKIIQKSAVQVLPVYFSGNNSNLFNILGVIHPALRTAKLPSELFNKNEKIIVRIGKPIPFNSLEQFENSDKLLRFLRAKTYSLGSALNVKSHFISGIVKRKKSAVHIIEPVETSLLENEIKNLKEHGHLILHHNKFEVFAASASEMPNLLKEISRLREITFREAGEGTNRSHDTDEFDLWYKHLFVWDNDALRVVGAYRLGEGDKLFARFKKKGFYLNQLFRFDWHFNKVFRSSIELGRSFIVSDYQKHPFSLLLLWKGIHEFIAQRKGVYQYLIGPVSISNNFSDLSKDILVDYISKNHFDLPLASSVKPRKRYRFKHKGEGKKLRNAGIKDMTLLENMIADIEPDQSKIPVLLKKYLLQNAKIIAFNVDPKFNKSLDGLLVLKLDDVPESTLDLVK